MIRNTSTITVLALFLSACCEKEGSFLNTIIKNRAAKSTITAQQEVIISQDSSTLYANAAAISIESTPTSLLISNENNFTIKETEVLALETSLEQQEILSKETNKTINVIPERPIIKELNITPSVEISNLPQTGTPKNVETDAITDIDQPESSFDNEHLSKNKINNSTKIVTANKDRSFRYQPIQITDQPITQKSEKNIDDRIMIEAIKKTELSFDYAYNEIKTSTDENKRQLPELISLSNEANNIENDNVSKKVKELASNNETKIDRNKRLLELLSKDIRQQRKSSNLKINRQSLQLLDDILSN